MNIPEHGLVLLDFTASHCGPCKMLTPVLAALEREYRGRFELVEVDCDHEQMTAMQYNVRATPTVVLVRDGREVGRMIGARPRAFVAGMIDRALGGDVAIASP